MATIPWIDFRKLFDLSQAMSLLSRAQLKRIVERTDTRSGRAFDVTMQSLILLSLVTFSLETLPDLDPLHRRILLIAEVFSVAVFTVEYALRLFVADRRLAFATSFLGVVDLLAILPFYLSLGVDLRSLRTFRMLRLLRIFKLARYNQAMCRFHRALLIAKEEIILFAIVSAILLYLAAVGIYYFENEAQPAEFASIFHSLWWAMVTLTTVGYGDVYPITAGGRCFTFLVLLVGLGIVSVPAGLVASALSQARDLEEASQLPAPDSQRPTPPEVDSCRIP